MLLIDCYSFNKGKIKKTNNKMQNKAKKIHQLSKLCFKWPKKKKKFQEPKVEQAA